MEPTGSPPNPIAGLAAVVGLGSCNAFAAAEFSPVAARRRLYSSPAGDRKQLARRAVQIVDRYISATQLGITLIGLGWIGEPALAGLIRNGFIGCRPRIRHPPASPPSR